jgi:hypothetical protein
MSRNNFRIAYVTLSTLVGVPFFLSVLVNDLPSSIRRSWLYFLVALTLLVIFAVYIELSQRKSAKTETDLGKVADELARSVYTQWHHEANARRIDTPARLPVAVRISEERPFDTRQEVNQRAMRWLPRSRLAGCDVAPENPSSGEEESTLEELFEKIPTGRLVVLGQPGAGKTVLLVKLLLYMLEQQNRQLPWAERSRKDKLIPLFASLSAWDPEEDLSAWLAGRLIAEHPTLQAPVQVGEGARTLAQALVEDNLILPVLDGFDEIPSAMQVMAIEKINAALSAVMNDPMAIVISGRSNEFRRAAANASSETRVTPGAVVVVLEDVSTDAAMEFLSGSESKRWAKVFAELGTESQIGKVLRTPLMLSLARAVYNWHPRGHEDEPLPSPDRLLDYRSTTDIENHLLDAFVPAAYRDRPERVRLAAIQALSYLAAYLDQGGRDPLKRSESMNSSPQKPESISFAWWDLRVVAGPIVGLTIGLPAAVTVGVVAAVIPGLGMGVGLGMITGLVIAVSVGMIAKRSWHVQVSPDPVGVGIVCGFVGALIGAVPTGVILHATGHASSPVPGLLGSLGAGIGPGVSGGIRRGIPAAVAGGIVCALTAGSGTGIPAGVVDGIGVWLAVALTVSVAGVRKPSLGIWRMGFSPAGYLVGAVAGLAVGTAVTLTKGPFPGVIAGMVSVLAGSAAGLEGIPADSTLAEAAASPARLLAGDRGTFWLVALVGGTAFGVGAGLGVRPEVGVAGALAVGLTAASLQASWLPFVITCMWCAATGRLPGLVMPFLARAHSRDILRQVGGVYEFRHVELQRRLAREYFSNHPPQQRNTLARTVARIRRRR